MRLLLVWLINALSLLAVAYFLPSVSVASFYIALITALVLGLLNTLIRPVLVLITLPITILTLGLFTLVINALLFWFVASFVAGFQVAGFESAFWGALLYSVISSLASWLLIPRPGKD
jgi:putative membrane protein